MLVVCLGIVRQECRTSGSLRPPHGEQKGRYDPKKQNVMKCLQK